MGTNGTRRELRFRLEGARRGLGLIDRTLDRDVRRVMLGCLVKDIQMVEHLAAASPLAPDEATLLAEIQAGAARVRRRSGAPIEPDQLEAFLGTRRKLPGGME